MKYPRQVIALAAAVPLAVAATFVPGLASHEGQHALPVVHAQVIAMPSGKGRATPQILDPTFNPAVQAILAGGVGGAAGVFGAAAADFIIKMTKKLVTLAEDEAESSSSDSSSSAGMPKHQVAFSRLYRTGDAQFDISGS
jgi:hypothetical protein